MFTHLSLLVPLILLIPYRNLESPLSRIFFTQDQPTSLVKQKAPLKL